MSDPSPSDLSKRHRAMFGCDVADLVLAQAQAAERGTSSAMLAVAWLSDAQEHLALADHPRQDRRRGSLQAARMLLNRAKWLLLDQDDAQRAEEEGS